jgi:ADP-heptose:LPS heptosyltransferase/lipopolysaccharide biosynthesis glycosyltransferase
VKKERKAITTIVSGEKYKAIWERVESYFIAYAERCDAELIVMSEGDVPSAHWLKFGMYDLLHKQFDRIAFIDADILIRPDTPSLFDIVPEDQFGIFNEGFYTPRSMCIHEVKKVYNVELPNWNGADYYNTGVMIVSRQHRHIFKVNGEIKNLRNAFGEQTYLNMRIMQSGVKVFPLHFDFNRMNILDRLTGMTRLNSYLVHYAGFDFQFGEGSVLKALDRDIELWKQNPEYKYKRQLFIWSFGGLGDVICAEPVIRFIREKAYPNEDIYVMTRNPELYAHIPNLHISDEYPKGDFDAVYEMNTHFVGHNQFHALVPHSLVHPVDWISMATMGRQLTDPEKEIHLQYTDEDLEEVKKIYPQPEELVLIHPGRGWETKTFPKEWWEQVITGIRSAGCKVALIGKEINSEHGYVKTDGEIDADFRDKISIKELIALIAKSQLLITNDSVPVHIAGAFDTKIILIPSCKHPDRILPYRKGTKYHRSKALYKKIVDDDHVTTPTSTIGWKMGDWQIGHFKPGHKIEEYIPEVDEVINETINFLCE